MLLKRSYVFLLLILSTACFARKAYDLSQEPPVIKYAAWFTGPLLSPTPINMEPGHPAIEPSVTFGSDYGIYNSNWSFESSDNVWWINPYVDYQFGFTDRVGLEILVSFISNFKKGTTVTRFQDSSILLGFQLANDVKGSWIPDIRIDLQQVFPTGSYRNLSPDNLGMDSTGQGAFQTGPVFIVHKTVYPWGNPLSLKASAGYLFPADVKVRGLSAYGGTPLTDGKVSPGQSLAVFFTWEYHLGQYWGIGCDNLYTYEKKSTFRGKTGGIPVGLPSSAQFSIAPFIERTFSSQSGALAGVWCSVGGRNSTAFASGYIAFLYAF